MGTPGVERPDVLKQQCESSLSLDSGYSFYANVGPVFASKRGKGLMIVRGHRASGIKLGLVTWTVLWPMIWAPQIQSIYIYQTYQKQRKQKTETR